MILERRPISSSNLALRFYVRDGWTKEELDACCQRGEVMISHQTDRDPYFILARNSAFNINDLLKRCSVLHRRFDDYPEESDAEFIRRMNW